MKREPEQACTCWHNPETGSLEACPKHEAEFMDRMMEHEDNTTRATGKTSTETLEYAAMIVGLLLNRPSAEIRKRLEAGETIATEHCDWCLAGRPRVEAAGVGAQVELFS